MKCAVGRSSGLLACMRPSRKEQRWAPVYSLLGLTPTLDLGYGYRRAQAGKVRPIGTNRTSFTNVHKCAVVLPREATWAAFLLPARYIWHMVALQAHFGTNCHHDDGFSPRRDLLFARIGSMAGGGQQVLRLRSVASDLTSLRMTTSREWADARSGVTFYSVASNQSPVANR